MAKAKTKKSKKGGGLPFSMPVMFLIGVALSIGAVVVYSTFFANQMPERYPRELMGKAYYELKDYNMINRLPVPKSEAQSTAPASLPENVATAVTKGLGWYLNNPAALTGGNIVGAQSAIAKEALLLWSIKDSCPEETKGFLEGYLRKACDQVCESWHALGGDFNAFSEPIAGGAILHVMHKMGHKCKGQAAKEIASWHFKPESSVYGFESAALFASLLKDMNLLDEEAFTTGIRESALKVGATNGWLQAALEGKIEMPEDQVQKGKEPNAIDVWIKSFMAFLQDITHIQSMKLSFDFLSEKDVASVADILSKASEAVAEQEPMFSGDFTARLVAAVHHFDVVKRVGGSTADSLAVIEKALLKRQTKDGAFGDKTPFLKNLYSQDGAEDKMVKEHMMSVLKSQTANSIWALAVSHDQQA